MQPTAPGPGWPSAPGKGSPPLQASELERLVREVEPTAFLLPPRLLRRVIKQDGGLVGLGLMVPHRRSYVISRDKLLKIVSHLELDLEPNIELPATIILLARPTQGALADTPRASILVKYWRMLFHARIHLALENRFLEGRLTPADIRVRVEQIGETEFEEIRSVLRHDKYLLAEDDRSVYVEFAAVYLELRHFAALLLGHFFPTIKRYERIEQILAAEVDSEQLLVATRLPGTPDPGVTEPPEVEDGEAPLPPDQEPATGKHPAYRLFKLLNRRAKRASQRGNVVRAGLAKLQAAAVGPPKKREEMRAASRAELDRLAARLQTAAGTDATDAASWRKALGPLLKPAARGVWPVEARLLYDLQKVCLDHEKELYAVDVVEWARSLGQRPIKRPVPYQREVLAVQHLRAAAGRLKSARLAEPNRQRLAELLRRTVHHYEQRLRKRFGPIIRRTLEDVGMQPRNLPEEVALNKLVQELLDSIVEHGFLTMGDLRDALSRNNLKLPDLAGLGEFALGDRLIRANRRLALNLDGVYRRGEIYLRWLQRLSAVAFGTWMGRFLTRYIVLPFGGSFVILAGSQFIIDEVVHQSHKLLGTPVPESVHAAAVQHVAEDVEDDLDDFTNVSRPPHHHVPVIRLLTPSSLVGLGVFLFALMHAAGFRKMVLQALWLTYRGIRLILIDLPICVLRLDVVRWVLDTSIFKLLLQWVLKPLFITGPVAVTLWIAGVAPNWTAAIGGATFLLTSLAWNTRLGRDLEEAITDWAVNVWQRIQFELLPGLFRLVMNVFKRLLEFVDQGLYRVDEWLRFRTGDGQPALIVKAVLGVVWFVVTYVVRIYVNLLIEPTVNPIKHFPVVTVAAKFMLPLWPLLEPILAAGLVSLGMPPKIATVAAVLNLVCLPGVFGFLVWELKENWRLYEANRPRALRPVMIGPHGETMTRLLRPGLHSGTIPKLFAKLRRADRAAQRTGAWKAVRKQREALHHLEERVRHFVDRELVYLLDHCGRWRSGPLETGQVALATNRIRMELRCPALSSAGLQVMFDEREGWLVASLGELGWLTPLSSSPRQVLATVLAGLYKLAGVDMVREQIEASLPPGSRPYRIITQGLHFPRPNNEQADGQVIEPPLFKNVTITWEQWVQCWEEAGKPEEFCANLLPIRAGS
jgi:hypothetical protein